MPGGTYIERSINVMDKPIENIIEYTKQLKLQYAIGNTTEHSFRIYLYNLFKALYPQQYYSMTNEPQRIKCGAPDYIIQCKGIPVGYIETKDIVKNLDKLDDREKDQFTRYTESLDNIIYTNYLDFRLYRNQELVKEVSIGGIVNGKLHFFKENNQKLTELIQDFVSFGGISITSPEVLARQMARKAREFANAIYTVLTSKDDSFQASSLQSQFKTFKKVLIDNLDAVSFSDMYAQTVAYGLFAARLNDSTPEDFSRDEAVHLIPRNNQFLRSLFESITGTNLDPAVEWIVNDLTNMFRHTNLQEILKTYGHTTATNDPFVHFYETFLHEYDPQTKQELGVYYTPKPVVNFIVKSIDYVLKHELNVLDGLANTDKIPVKVDSIVTEGKLVDGKRRKLKHEKKGTSEVILHKVQILDPAVGTGTFPAEVIRYISNQFTSQAGLWGAYVKNDLLPRINGFELMMVPYTICHLKLDMLLQETGYNMATDDDARMNVYLTDTLEKSHEETQSLWAAFLSQEADLANLVKNYKPIMVVLGNPPYNDSSTNKGEWIMKKMEDYKKEPVTGERLQEQNLKYINDDYLKFVRYAQFLIDKNQEGIVAYINPHGYLDAVTMRGVRWSLLTSFDSIYVLNLHGNTNKGETCPDGSVDQNVFDIMQGVCVNVFVKKRNHDKNKIATVYYADLYGKRADKYDYLSANDVSTIKWTKFIPQPKNYFMTPINTNENTYTNYISGIQINELFPINCTGFQTHRDNFAVAITKEEMQNRLTALQSEELSDAEISNLYKIKNNRDWQINTARARAASSNVNINLTKCLYRPFDYRWCYLNKIFMDFPRKEIVNNILNKENLCILTTRQQATVGFNHIWITDLPVDSCIISTASREGGQVFPLYLYSPDNELFEQPAKHPNINPTALRKFCKIAKLSMVAAKTLKKKNTQFTPEELIYYIYAALSAKKYSEDYSVYLKSDYPYVPVPKTADAFFELSALGNELAQITMMHTVTPRTDLKTTYPVSGQSDITKAEYKNEKIYINDAQYFGNVSADVWNFIAGHHQPAELWLKQRKGRILTSGEIIYYQRMLAAIKKTIEIKTRISDTYEKYF